MPSPEEGKTPSEAVLETRLFDSHPQIVFIGNQIDAAESEQKIGLLGYFSWHQASSFATLGWIQMRNRDVLLGDVTIKLCVDDEQLPGVANTTKRGVDEARVDLRGVTGAFYPSSR